MIWPAWWLGVELPPGVELPDGRVLTFPAHRGCDCTDCVDAWTAYRAGTLIFPTAEVP